MGVPMGALDCRGSSSIRYSLRALSSWARSRRVCVAASGMNALRCGRAGDIGHDLAWQEHVGELGQELDPPPTDRVRKTGVERLKLSRELRRDSQIDPALRSSKMLCDLRFQDPCASIRRLQRLVGCPGLPRNVIEL